jgi:LacI family transcriptional regulator
MRELGFVRNESARQLRVGHSSTLAYVMLDARNPFFTDVARDIEGVAEDAGLSLFLCNSDQRSERERTYLTRLEQQRVQGVLITPSDLDSPLLTELPRRGTPVVIVDRMRSAGTHCTVAVDDELGGRIAVEHLLEAGHERVAFVGGPETLGQVRDRLHGARTAWAEAGRDPDALTVLRTDGLTVAEGSSAAQRIAGTSKRSRPTAAFCANDLLALGVLQGSLGLGLRVPEDLAVIGYDDIDFAAAAAVPLTSVRQPRADLGRRAAELLLDETSDSVHTHEQVVFTPELVARASTRTHR